jgi:hypothetical protein
MTVVVAWLAELVFGFMHLFGCLRASVRRIGCAVPGSWFVAWSHSPKQVKCLGAGSGAMREHDDQGSVARFVDAVGAFRRR